MKILGENKPERLSHFIKKARQFRIPDFQRAYAWGNEQIENFIDSVESVINGDKNHFFGTVIYFPEAEHYTVIDGQQRLTTTILFLTASFHILAEHPERSNNWTAENLQNDFLFDTSDNENKIILRAATTDRDTFERILHNHVTPLDEYKPIFRNYKKFFDYLSTKDVLDEYIDAFSKFEIITIALDSNDDNPQIIFENINSTGEPLSAGDKIRNYALMLKTDDIRNYVYNTHWLSIENLLTRTVKGNQESFISDFFRNMIIADTSKWHSESQTYKLFKDYYNERIKDQNLEELNAFYNKTKSYLDSYLFLKFLDKEDDDYSFIKDFNFRLHFVDNDIRIPFLMQILEKYKTAEITREDTKRVFDFFDRYIGRRLISGNGIKGNQLMPTWVNAIDKNMKETISLGEETTFGEEFIKLLSNIGSYNYGVPTDSELEYAITKESYKNAYVQYIYATICDKNYKQNNETLPPNILRNIYNKNLELTIEHIMPQTLNKEWVEDLGPDWQRIYDEYLNRLTNLTLTGYNSKYSNRPFAEKCNIDEVGFIDSPLLINKMIGNFDKWDENAMKEREKWLQDIIKKTWKWPAKYSNQISLSDQQDGMSPEYSDIVTIDLLQDDFDDTYFTHIKPTSVIINGETFHTRNWRDLMGISLEKIHEVDDSILPESIDDLDFSYDNRSKAEGGKLWTPCLVRNTNIYFEGNRSAHSTYEKLKKLIRINDLEGKVDIRISLPSNKQL